VNILNTCSNFQVLILGVQKVYTVVFCVLTPCDLLGWYQVRNNRLPPSAEYTESTCIIITVTLGTAVIVFIMYFLHWSPILTEINSEYISTFHTLHPTVIRVAT
jgi:hypothetical protein